MSTSRPRAPLASIPNATNSPHRTLGHSTKRPRAQANFAQQENEPPQKRQMVEKDASRVPPATPRRKIPPSTLEGRVFEKGTVNGKPTAFQRKLVAARDRGAALKITKNVEGPTAQNLETIRLWQKHYRKVFPEYTFYFESIPEDLKARFSRQIAGLGAREEKFFSRSVTHIVTTRPIPPEIEEPPSASTETSTDTSNGDSQTRTINPNLLEKNASLSLSARNHSSTQQAQNVRRDGPSNMDILVRGRQMGMKLWAAEKLQRILAHMFDESALHGHNTRGNNIVVSTVRAREEDLSQVLRNEKQNGPTDRDPSAFTKDLVLFKGPFIYIHDMDGKTRPTMIREYPKVARRQDGAWPQFRSAAVGKCPFVEDHMSKKELEREREKERAMALQLEREAQQQAPRTRSVAAVESAQMDPPRRTSPRKALREVPNVPNGPSLSTGPKTFSKPIAPPKVERHTAFLPATAETPPLGFIRPPHMHFAREPAASGIQQSNLTSAIRSNMISSTAAAPGTKAGTSREVHELKRKVLERSNTGSLSVGSMPSSYRMTDLAGHLKNARAPAPQRAAKSRAQEKLGGIQEEDNPSEDELAAERATHTLSRNKRVAKKDPKPGYCENCRDKYDDFDEHIVSRKHRKFAMTPSNWADLDQLLRKLQEPC